MEDHELFEDFEFWDRAGEEPSKPDIAVTLLGNNNPSQGQLEYHSSHMAALALVGPDELGSNSSNQSVGRVFRM